MLAKILKRHTSRDHLHHGNTNNKHSPSKNSGIVAVNTNYPANTTTNGQNLNGGLPVSLTVKLIKKLRSLILLHQRRFLLYFYFRFPNCLAAAVASTIHLSTARDFRPLFRI